MPFTLGAGSRAELAGVHPALVAVVERAIVITAQDFTVHDGVRTLAQQRALVAKGASKTMNSRHLVKADGFGHAVDLVPWEGGKLRWEWPLIYPIAAAMCQAAREFDQALIWGGVWDRRLDRLTPSAEALKAAVAEYCVRHPGPDFIDGPHFELVS